MAETASGGREAGELEPIRWPCIEHAPRDGSWVILGNLDGNSWQVCTAKWDGIGWRIAGGRGLPISHVLDKTHYLPIAPPDQETIVQARAIIATDPDHA